MTDPSPLEVVGGKVVVVGKLGDVAAEAFGDSLQVLKDVIVMK